MSTVHVTLESIETEPVEHATWKGAEDHVRQLVAILTNTTDTYPLHAFHDAQGTTYTASGYSEIYGEWSVDLTVRDV